MEIFSEPKGFDWDEGNIKKNWEKHKVTYLECEEVFFNEPTVVEQNKTHALTEERYYVLGETNAGRLLFVVFTMRGDKIRVISARDMNKKERRYYK